MALNTPTTGTIPALPQYGTGGLAIASTVSIEIVDTTNATTAASFRMLLSDFVGKAPGILPPATPTANDLVSFLQVSSNLPRQTPIGNFGVAFGNLPIGGATGTILYKTSGSNFQAAWTGIVNFLTAGTSMTTSGSTVATIGVADFGIGSTQIATGAVGSVQIATNAVGNAQLRQGSPLSVIGVGGNATANVADIVASGGGLLLQTNAGGTAVIFGPLNTTLLPGPFQVSSFTANQVLVGNGTNAIQLSGVATTGFVLTGNGTSAVPTFQSPGAAPAPVNTTSFPAHAVLLGNGTSLLNSVAAATTGFVLAGQGTTVDPAFVAINSLAVSNITAGGGLSAGGVSTTGGSISTTGTLSRVELASIKTATYTAVAADLGSMVAFSTGALATFALPQATGSNFGSGFFLDVVNFATSTSVVLAPQSSVFTGLAATALLGPNQFARVVSDGTNYMLFGCGPLAVSAINTAQTFRGGLRLVAFNAGTTTGGTAITFDSGKGPIQVITNNGTGTFTAPANDGEIDCMVIGTTNASTITFSGFAVGTSIGDTYVANATSLFILSVRRINGTSTYRWAALQ